MSYSYEKERPELFTEFGVKTLTVIRDNAKRLLKVAGAFTAEKAFEGATGSSWTMLAALDYLVEQGEIIRVTAPGETWGQHQVFTGRLQ